MEPYITRAKLLVRLELCKSELKRAKNALGFWSKELALVVDAISDDKQFNFEEFLKQENQS